MSDEQSCGAKELFANSIKSGMTHTFAQKNPLISKQGQSHDQGRICQARLMQNKVGVADKIAVTHDYRAWIVAKQLIISGQESRL